jgi:two-component system, sensor histidine kinase and response regulator
LGTLNKYSGGKENPRIEVGVYRENGSEGFFVKDNGVGFDARDQDKLFKVYQRLHSAEEFEGIGIGLALVHKIVTKHGGKVWAEGELKKALPFTLL